MINQKGQVFRINLRNDGVENKQKTIENTWSWHENACSNRM